MAHFRSVAHLGGYGFDAARNLLIVPPGKNTAVYLIAGRDLWLDVADEEVATLTPGAVARQVTGDFTDWEKSQDIRAFAIHGRKPGSTVLRAFSPDNKPMTAPLTIRVVASNEHRQANGTPETCKLMTPEISAEIRKMSWRDAVIRVAEDQMNSSVGRQPKGGNGVYDDAGVMWCGSFIWWCHNAVASVKGVPNPFGSMGGSSNALRSGIKALSWGMTNPGIATVMRYAGPDPFRGGTMRQSFIDISPEHPVRRGDICLPRGDQGSFPHVSMVHDINVTSGSFRTIDGNQTGSTYAIGSQNQCIGINLHPDVDRKIADRKTYRYVFVHVNYPDE